MSIPDNLNKSQQLEARRNSKRRASSFVENTQHRVAAKFGAELRRRRLELGLTQSELAQATGLNRSYISEVEGGRQSISLDRAASLAKSVDSRLVDLLGDL